MLGSRMTRAADADHFLFAVAADEFTGENEFIDIFLLPGKVLVCVADFLNGLPCAFIDQLRVDVGIDGIAVPDFSGIFCISYVKWDMNRFITECYSASLPSYRQGEFMHRYILGVYNLAERLTSDFPNVFFEGCASGGGRFDAGMLYYFPQIWTSDDTDGYERAKIQWGTSLCYPLSAMSCHVSACPNHQTGRTAIASLGASGYELNVSALSNEEKNACKEQITVYRKISDLVLRGDLFRLIDPFSENCFCEMIVSKDKRCAYVVGEQLRAMPLPNTRFVKLVGLAEGKRYHIEELNIAASGKTLASVGVPLPNLQDYESFIWHIEEVKI